MHMSAVCKVGQYSGVGVGGSKKFIYWPHIQNELHDVDIQYGTIAVDYNTLRPTIQYTISNKTV